MKSFRIFRWLELNIGESLDLIKFFMSRFSAYNEKFLPEKSQSGKLRLYEKFQRRIDIMKMKDYWKDCWFPPVHNVTQKFSQQ